MVTDTEEKATGQVAPTRHNGARFTRGPARWESTRLTIEEQPCWSVTLERLKPAVGGVREGGSYRPPSPPFVGVLFRGWQRTRFRSWEIAVRDGGRNREGNQIVDLRRTVRGEDQTLTIWWGRRKIQVVRRRALISDS